MVINLSHIEVVRLHQAEIRAEITRNHLIEAARQSSPSFVASQPVGSIMIDLRRAQGSVRNSLRQAIASLAALASIG